MCEHRISCVQYSCRRLARTDRIFLMASDTDEETLHFKFTNTGHDILTDLYLGFRTCNVTFVFDSWGAESL